MTPTAKFTAALWDAFIELTEGTVGEPDLHVCRGYWTHAQQDVMAWQGYIKINGRKFQIGSWDSVTHCARRGFSIVDERSNDRREVDYQIFANPRKNPHAVSLGRTGGQVKSERKAAAARANGKKGGRPKKVTSAPVPSTRRLRRLP